MDNSGIQPDAYDEGCALVNAPSVVFRRCRFRGWGKACLVGNGDHPTEDNHFLKVTFDSCIFEGCGRRSPYIQFGNATLCSCLIRNWGDPNYFYLKSHGLRVGPTASCTVSNTIFWQDCFFPGWKNFWSDVCSQYDPPLIPGNFRGAYSEKGGNLELSGCYFNSPWIYHNGKVDGRMSEADANRLLRSLDSIVPKLK